MSTLLNEIFQEVNAGWISRRHNCSCSECQKQRQLEFELSQTGTREMDLSVHSAGCNCRNCQVKYGNNSLVAEIFRELELPSKFDGIPLKTTQKDALRSQARRGRDKIAAWRRRCLELKNCHIHHIIPLQYIHLFQGMNPNHKSNVFLLSGEQHHRIHAALRKRLESAKNDADRKDILQKFKTYVRKLRYYNNAKVPKSYKKSILREILRELQLN